MILSHFSEKPLKLDQEKSYSFKQGKDWFKPTGLWLSDESDHGWKKWCKGERFGLDRLKHETKFKVDLENILVLNTSKKIRKFHEKFKHNPYKLFIIDFPEHYVNWSKVTELYSGIIITPYQWSLRLDRDLFWYYAWDCASGCVWNLTKLKIL